MKTRTFCGVAVVAALLLLAPRVSAQNDLYDNGPTDGYTLGWTINFGFAVSDSFTVSNSTIRSMQFAAWLFPGDVLQTAELSITSSEFGGTAYFDQTVLFTANNCFSNGEGFNVCNEAADFSPVSLNAGTYWLTLQNAVVNSGDPVYWDMNSGPSLASESSIGTIPSESFSIGLGCGGNPAGCGPPPTTPEPGSWLLFGSGTVTLLSFFKVLRRL